MGAGITSAGALDCKATMKYIVDTNIFNKLVDGLLDPADLPMKGSFVAIHLQVDEINNTKDSERRARLFLTFAEMAPEVVPSESFVIGVSRIGHAKTGWNGPSMYDEIKARLDALNGGKRNNIIDALIAEAAIVNNYVLITSDFHLAEVAKSLGAQVTYFAI
jgi:rRNA-processing protein FCF1